jgi:chemotaxis protein CheZ
MLEAPERVPEVLARRLAVIRDRYPTSDPQMVASVVRAVLFTMRGDLSAKETGLLHEVEELGRTIANARAEIAALQVDDISASHIPSATDELDAIVEHTAAATNSILEVCETLDKVSGKLDGEGAQVMQDATTKIYEACSFQDITGQRITKIVATLKAIDSKIAQMVTTFSEAHRDSDYVPTASGAPTEIVVGPVPTNGDPPPLGPQLPGNAMDQTDIDKLLASFD